MTKNIIFDNVPNIEYSLGVTPNNPSNITSNKCRKKSLCVTHEKDVEDIKSSSN